MNFPFYIARRYLFSKKSHNAINIISMIAACGVAVAVMATVCTMSVFNGFESLVSGMFSAFDPELKITPAKGKVFNPHTDMFLEIKMLPGIELVSESLEDNALVGYRGSQAPIVLKGVEDNFAELSNFEDVLIDGEWGLRDEVGNARAFLGLQLANNLGINARFIFPMEILTPRRNVPVNPSNPAASFNRDYAYMGGVFRVNQQIYDDNYMLIPIDLARELFDYENEVSALELKLQEGINTNRIKSEIRGILGGDYLVKDRYEQQEESFKMMQIEKWVVFLLLCFILLIAVFNVIASLSMLILEKKEDVETLRNMGANNKQISQIFLFEGWMIITLGVVVGIVLGCLLCLGQQYYGWLKLGTGNFAVSAYPVVTHSFDIVITAVTALTIGFVTVLYPIRFLAKKWLR